MGESLHNRTWIIICSHSGQLVLVLPNHYSIFAITPNLVKVGINKDTLCVNGVDATFLSPMNFVYVYQVVVCHNSYSQVHVCVQYNQLHVHDCNFAVNSQVAKNKSTNDSQEQ